MDYLQLISLALIQGLTEFLPISSSAHLILPFQVLGWPDQGLAFDTAVHLGSLLAVLWYFRVDLYRLITATLAFTFSGKSTNDSRFAINLLIGSLPIIPAGLLLESMVESNFRAIGVIAFTTISFGLLLWLADVKGQRVRTESELTWRQAALSRCSSFISSRTSSKLSGIQRRMVARDARISGARRRS